VAIVNRSVVSKQTKVLDEIHKVISLETDDLITEGSKACVTGLNDELVANNRFENVVKLDTTELTSFGAGVFPSALDWAQVEKICRDTKTDALFSLELFDADTKLNYFSSPGKINTIVGSIVAAQQNVTMNTLVKTGWRIYDPADKIILDESYISKELQFHGQGINPVVAASALIGKKEAVKQAANEAGHIYVGRIDPYWIRVHREYFVRGNSNLELAKRKAQTGNWDEAGNLWEKETSSSSYKVAGRACYNMAIINEINGDIDAAIQWAQKAYENYRVKIALSYVNILRNRKEKEEELASQGQN